MNTEVLIEPGAKKDWLSVSYSVVAVFFALKYESLSDILMTGESSSIDIKYSEDSKDVTLFSRALFISIS